MPILVNLSQSLLDLFNKVNKTLLDKEHERGRYQDQVDHGMVDFVSLTEAGGMEVSIYLQWVAIVKVTNSLYITQNSTLLRGTWNVDTSCFMSENCNSFTKVVYSTERIAWAPQWYQRLLGTFKE